MAWTAPRTWVTGETVTAALLNTHLRDNLLAIVPLSNGISVTTFTPTVSQPSALTLSVATGRYFQFGKIIFATVDITINSAGTGGNFIVVGALPVAANTSGVPGHGYYFDASASIYTISSYWNSTTAAYLLATTSTLASPFGGTPAVTAAASDQIHMQFVYEVP